MERWKLPCLAASLSVLLLAACPEEPAPVAAPTAEERLARVIKLEDERSQGDGELEALLADLDGRVRARAALALGRIGDPEAAPALTSLLRDESAYVRSMAAFSLGILEGTISPDTIERLTEALRDEDPTVRGRAAEALARKQGEAASEAIGSALAENLPRGGEPYDWQELVTGSSAVGFPHPDLRLGLFALAKLSSSSAAASLITTEGGAPRFNWWPAAWTASQLEGDALQSVHLFYAGSPDPMLRLYGARGIGRLSSERARDQLRPLLFDPSETVRIEAIRAAARIGEQSLLPDLLSHLEADTRYVQVEILKALVVLVSKEAVEPIIDRVGSDSPWMRAQALAALARQDPESFWLLLAGIGDDPAWETRRAIAELLPKLPSERPKNILREMTEDPDARVRAAALWSLGERDREGALGVSIQHLRADDPWERVAAARTLAAVGSKEAFTPMEQAFLVESDEDPRVRAALLKALAALDFERARGAVESATSDTGHHLRSVAASILDRAGMGPVEVRPRSSERGLDEYLAGLTAPYSPQAFLKTSRGTAEIELFIADAPQTVANFIRLARKGFFEGQKFYEVVPNGHVASGDPRGDGNGGPGYLIRSEINDRPFFRGSLAMMDVDRDAGGSRFFITHLPEPALEGRFTVFGQVNRGMEVVDSLEPSDTIEKVTIWDGITPP